MSWGTLTLVAGPNGAGKTTLVRKLAATGQLADHVLLNADDRTLEKLRAAGIPSFASAPSHLLKEFFILAAQEVFEEMTQLLSAGSNVCVETVLSTDKYRSVVESLLANGGSFELVYVALQTPEVSRSRVTIRVHKGGHDVPTSKLADRWNRSLAELKWFARRASRTVVFDNSSTEPRQLAVGESGRLLWSVPTDTVFPELREALRVAFQDSP